ncbi:TetR/AcrR family transcriptional regulator [Agrobacterium tumefaciens]|uniref:TetR/AcrR family transcriptional regulator n=1 Tax=Agrobacterium tumefaciens TaxID=358 RepID=UPI0012B89FAD|nr:TetR/AcrR family transcriptional regulator [Agrobacterium tumefaciens]MQB07269.1 TetR/AcrR family transcriptional regulator [Agrobacterium tumefaciens]
MIPQHQSKGKPRTFDREGVLKKALGVFWLRGFEPASMAELCGAMEIKPPSLYAAFGNKAQLFMEAVNHYENVFWNGAWQRLEDEPDLHKAMISFFQEAAEILTSQDAPCGCMIVLGAANVSRESQDVNDALKALREEGRECFLARLKQGIAAGDLSADADVNILASLLNTVFHGMSIQARDGSCQAELERVSSAVMTVIPSRPGLRLRSA